MTLNESQLISRLTSVDARSSATRAFAVVNIVLDFKKWNLHFCHENTDVEWSDDLYGRPGLFTFTHDFFEKATMYLSSGVEGFRV